MNRGEPTRPGGHQPLNVADAYRPGRPRRRRPAAATSQVPPSNSQVREVTGVLKIQRGPWKTEASFDQSAVHIRPRADLRWHVLDESCWCGPARCAAETTDGDEIPVWQHIAADGRE